MQEDSSQMKEVDSASVVGLRSFCPQGESSDGIDADFDVSKS